MASVASCRVLFASIGISWLFHIAILSLPLRIKVIASPIQFHLGKVTLHGAEPVDQNSRLQWSLKNAIASNYSDSDIFGASEKRATINSPAILLPEQPQDIA